MVLTETDKCLEEIENTQFFFSKIIYIKYNLKRVKLLKTTG